MRHECHLKEGVIRSTHWVKYRGNPVIPRYHNCIKQSPLSTGLLYPKFEAKTLGIAILWAGVQVDIAIKHFAVTKSLQPAAALHRHSYIKILNNSQITEFFMIFTKIRSVPAAFWEETPLSGVPALLRSDIVAVVLLYCISVWNSLIFELVDFWHIFFFKFYLQPSI